MVKKKEKPMDIHNIKECPDCASQNLVYNDERQQAICRDCGLIYEPLAPEIEKRFEATHGMAPREATERIMIKIAEEKPRKPAKKKAKKRKAKKKAVKKKAKKKPAKKKAVKKKAKPKKKAAKKPVKKKAKKKPAKPKKKSLLGHLKARFKRKR